MRGPARRAAVALAVLAATAAGCGGGDRQDANEPNATFDLDVVSSSFPARQHLARQEQMVIAVRNADRRTIPNVAVTVTSFATRDQRPDLADPERPVWVVDTGPHGGTSAYVNTWALGALRPGHTARFVWHVTPVRSGTHRVSWRVAAGLNGKAKARVVHGRPSGAFTVRIDQRPAQARVDPDTGKVIRSGG